MKKAVAVLVMLIMAGVSWFTLQTGAWTRISVAVADCTTIEATAREALASGDMATANYRFQEAAVCRGESLDTWQPKGKPTQEPNKAPTAPPSSTSEPSASSSPSSSETSTAPQARHWEYLANRPLSEKVDINAFGPRHGLAVDKDLGTIDTVDEALIELRYRLSIDPMLTAATGAANSLWPYNQVDAKTEVFANDHAAWDQANAEINRKIDDALAANTVSIVTLNGLYSATYSIPGYPPNVRADYAVPRQGQAALSINGHLFQLECGFQEYWLQQTADVPAAPAEAPVMPPPSPGMDRTPEGTPVVVVDTPSTTTPPPTTVTTSPPGTSEPPSTTSPPSEDLPSKIPSVIPTHESHDPVGDPPGTVETEAATPEQPADPAVEPGSGSTQQAPGATQAPQPTAAVPTQEVSNDNSAPAEGGTACVDPDTGEPC